MQECPRTRGCHVRCVTAAIGRPPSIASRPGARQRHARRHQSSSSGAGVTLTVLQHVKTAGTSGPGTPILAAARPQPALRHAAARLAPQPGPPRRLPRESRHRKQATHAAERRQSKAVCRRFLSLDAAATATAGPRSRPSCCRWCVLLRQPATRTAWWAEPQHGFKVRPPRAPTSAWTSTCSGIKCRRAGGVRGRGRGAGGGPRTSCGWVCRRVGGRARRAGGWGELALYGPAVDGLLPAGVAVRAAGAQPLGRAHCGAPSPAKLPGGGAHI